MEGKQLSTSRGRSRSTSATCSSRYDADPLRYFLTAAGPETQDSDFTWAEFLRRNNDELLANWGNLVNRTLDERARATSERCRSPASFTDEDREALAGRRPTLRPVGQSIEEARFKRAHRGGDAALEHRRTNTSTIRPRGRVIKDDRERAATILFVALRIVDSLKVIFAPFLPFSSQNAARAARLRGLHRRSARVPARSRRRRKNGTTILTGDYSGWIGALGAERAPRLGRTCGSRARSSESSSRVSSPTSSLASTET